MIKRVFFDLITYPFAGVNGVGCAVFYRLTLDRREIIIIDIDRQYNQIVSNRAAAGSQTDRR